MVWHVLLALCVYLGRMLLCILNLHGVLRDFVDRCQATRIVVARDAKVVSRFYAFIGPDIHIDLLANTKKLIEIASHQDVPDIFALHRLIYLEWSRTRGKGHCRPLREGDEEVTWNHRLTGKLHYPNCALAFEVCNSHMPNVSVHPTYLLDG